jgi:hypothetical protein
LRPAIDLPAFHPIRILLDSAVQQWKMSLIEALFTESEPSSRGTPLLTELRAALTAMDWRRLEGLFENASWPFAGYLPPPPRSVVIANTPLTLTIERVIPPPAWQAGQAVRVDFKLQNGSDQPSTGLVYGTATQETDLNHHAAAQEASCDSWSRRAGLIFNRALLISLPGRSGMAP